MLPAELVLELKLRYICDLVYEAQGEFDRAEESNRRRQTEALFLRKLQLADFVFEHRYHIHFDTKAADIAAAAGEEETT